MLSIQKISKSYARRGKVLNELSLEIAEKDLISIMGPSGSGKTTLLNIIGLLDRPDTGRVTYRGAPVNSFSDDEAATYRNRNIGIVFQEHMLLNHLTVLDNILLPLLAAGYRKDELHENEIRLKSLMERTSLAQLGDKYPFQISGGEAQRVAVVRALANNPSILLADEPTGSLDRKNAETLGDLLLEINRIYGVAVILATHSPELALKMKLKLNLSEGKLV